MRTIKFRYWHNNKWNYCGIEGIPKEIENEIDYTLVHQYTGLKDKNGVEIFEGDILASSNRSGYESKNYVAYEVFYHENDSCEYNVGFQMNRHHFQGAICGTSDFRKFKPSTVSRMEIIGDKYNNPKLL